MDPIPPSLRHIDGLNSSPGVGLFDSIEEIQGIFLVGKRADLNPEESHIGSTSLKADHSQFNLIRSRTCHPKRLGAGQREVENATSRKWAAIIHSHGDLTTGS